MGFGNPDLLLTSCVLQKITVFSPIKLDKNTYFKTGLNGAEVSKLFLIKSQIIRIWGLVVIWSVSKIVTY